MAKDGNGMTYTNPYSQMNRNSEDAESGPLWFSYQEQDKDHLKSGNEFESANTSIGGYFGGPTAGEENPFGLGNSK